MDWKLVNSEYLYKEPWLTLRRDICETPAGVTVNPYYVLEYPDWVCVMAVTADHQVILIRQYRHAFGTVLLEIPGGVIDPEDPVPLDAARRELLEETGYAFEQFYSLGAVSHNPSTSTNLTHMFLATGGKYVQAQQLDANEEIEVLLKDVNEVEQMLKEHQFVQALHVSCLHYGLEKIKELRADMNRGE
ncbi:NUDIX hydrolase [Chitinophaga lutea]|uniref:GDP-mannose pyrophosphatase n=1 Tax=Chitinophaga lutea TaxID=2488634 RepID=A0A3N4Q271_9BACT|nr:NUDIX hydrolase [Chitinophaga lutea]RPE05874.1 NUDIX hydrolase [Chitinophaga lutea]